MTFLSIFWTMTLEVEKRQENWISHHFCDTTASRVPALWTETSLWSLVFDETDLTLCVILLPFTPARGAQAGPRRPVKAKAEPYPRAQGAGLSRCKRQIEEAGGRQCAKALSKFWGTRVQGLSLLAGWIASAAGFCLQQVGVLPPANTVPKRFQTKGLGCFAKLLQRLNQSY